MCGQESAVLYITGTPAIKNHLLELAKKDYSPGLYACDIQTFKASMGRAEFVNMGGKRFRLAKEGTGSFEIASVAEATSQ